jgi:hypothetical protein
MADELSGACKMEFLKGDGSFTPLNTRFLHLFPTFFFLDIVSVHNHHAYFKILQQNTRVPFRC